MCGSATRIWWHGAPSAALVFAGIVLLNGCNSSDQQSEISRGGDVRFQTPVVLREVANLDPENLILEVLVNDQITELTRGDGDIWTGVINVPANQSSSVAVRWGQVYGEAGYITLAEQRKSVFSGTEGNSVTFNGGYDTESFNVDDDAYSNLTEVQEGRSPVEFLDVTINTDGAFETGGVAFTFADECGSQIPIAVPTQPDNITVTGAADLAAWWCATLVAQQVDAQGNTIPVDSIRFVVNVTDDILFNDDSGREYHDDSVEIYIDGNNSKRTVYDGIDDFNLRFVPVGQGLVQTGNSLPVPSDLTAYFNYFNGGYQLIAYLPIDSLGIANAQAFGLNLQVNDDDNGGDRDAKYSWIGIENRDISWRNPTAFGTAQIP